MSSESEVQIRVLPTPNPHAWKFVLDRVVLVEGKATYNSPEQAYGNKLAVSLMSVDGVKQVHFFQNVITVTAHFDADEDQVQSDVYKSIKNLINNHDPQFGVEESKKALRKEVPKEIQEIEEILDRTVRPGLRGDGGDIEVVKFEDDKLYVHYEGACGTCPSATTGTLMAIESILSNELQRTIEVIPC